MSRTKNIIYTTNNDLSVALFAQAGWEIHYYDQPAVARGDLVYFRDPFNDPDYHPDSATLDDLISEYQDATVIDRISSFQDLIDLEDKYLQSSTYGDLYPRTWLPSQRPFIPGGSLAKPRISQRAKDILFSLDDGRALDDRWIIQDLLDIREELRVYAIYGKILDLASIKSSKSTGKVKIIGERTLTSSEITFIRCALEKCPLDIVGFDLAILPNNQYKIIEANRSPQFRRYAERTGLNLAELIKKRP